MEGSTNIEAWELSLRQDRKLEECDVNVEVCACSPPSRPPLLYDKRKSLYLSCPDLLEINNSSEHPPSPLPQAFHSQSSSNSNGTAYYGSSDSLSYSDCRSPSFSPEGSPIKAGTDGDSRSATPNTGNRSRAKRKRAKKSLKRREKAGQHLTPVVTNTLTSSKSYSTLDRAKKGLGAFISPVHLFHLHGKKPRDNMDSVVDKASTLTSDRGGLGLKPELSPTHMLYLRSPRRMHGSVDMLEGFPHSKYPGLPHQARKQSVPNVIFRVKQPRGGLSAQHVVDRCSIGPSPIAIFISGSKESEGGGANDTDSETGECGLMVSALAGSIDRVSPGGREGGRKGGREGGRKGGREGGNRSGRRGGEGGGDIES